MTVIYHNPRCSKSRETLSLLEENNIPFDVRLYLTDLVSEDELRKLIDQLGISPIKLMRTKESLYKELNLDGANVTDDQRIKAMVQNPKLIERPIVVHNNKAKLGRPPENVLTLF